MMSLGVRPLGLKPGGRSKVTGGHTAQQHAGYLIRTDAYEDSNADDYRADSIVTDHDGGHISADQLVEAQSAAQRECTDLAAKILARVEEMLNHRGFDRARARILPSVLYTTFVTEAMRCANCALHIWGDATPVYFGALQAGALLGWLYLALRGAYVMPAPLWSVTQAKQALPDLKGAQVYQDALNLIKHAQEFMDGSNREIEVARVIRATVVALAAVFATELCRVLLLEWTSPAPGIVEMLVAAHIVAILAFMYCFHRSTEVVLRG